MNQGTPERIVLKVHVMKFSPFSFAKDLYNVSTLGAEQWVRDRLVKAGLSGDFRELAHAPEINAMTFAPVRAAEHGARYELDHWGVTFTGAGANDFQLAWTEIARVRLQIYRSVTLGINQLRFVWTPVDPPSATARFQILRENWDAEQGGAVTSIAAVIDPPLALRQEAQRALTEFAGPRFSGEIEEVASLPPASGEAQ